MNCFLIFVMGFFAGGLVLTLKTYSDLTSGKRVINWRGQRYRLVKHDAQQG